MIYDIDYFINKFEAIPADKWTTGTFIDKECRMCAYGHCGEREDEVTTEEARALTNLVRPYNPNNPYYITDINDGLYEYEKFGITPKERIVNYLKSLKSKKP